jgi:hypothetical protein
MSSDLQTRPRRDFGDLAKLADAYSQADREEGSGLVHLADLEAADRALVTSGGSLAPFGRSLTPSAPPEEARTERARGNAWRRRAALAGVAVFVAGALGGSVGSTMIRAITTGSRLASPSAPIQSAPSNPRTPNVEETTSLKLPLAVGAVNPPDAPAALSPPLAAGAPEALATPSAAPPKAVTRLSGPSPSSARASSADSLRRSEEGPPKEKLLPDATSVKPPPSTQSLGEQMEEAVASRAPAVGTSSNEGIAPSNPDGVAPMYPSLGAINSALGRALMEAQACVEGDEPISHARVRFNSTGVVEAVTVTGWAAGKPAESCVRDALMKPRVAPFLQASYVVPVTIRSN